MDFDEEETNKAIRYSEIRWEVIGLEDLSPTEALLLFLIYGLSRRNGSCYASKSHLAREINVTEPTIFKTLKILAAKNLIEKGAKTKYGVVRLKPTDKFKKVMAEIRSNTPSKFNINAALEELKADDLLEEP